MAKFKIILLRVVTLISWIQNLIRVVKKYMPMTGNQPYLIQKFLLYFFEIVFIVYASPTIPLIMLISF